MTKNGELGSPTEYISYHWKTLWKTVPTSANRSGKVMHKTQKLAEIVETLQKGYFRRL
jgi:hypothetical protein